MPWIRTTWAVLWSARSNAPAEDQSDMAPTRPNAAATTAATKASTRIRPGVPSRALLMALRERETAGVDAARDGTGVSSTTSAPAAADGVAVALLMSLLQPVGRARRTRRRCPASPPGYLPTSATCLPVPSPRQDQGCHRPAQGRPAAGSPRV